MRDFTSNPLILTNHSTDHDLESYINLPLAMLLLCLIRYSQHKPDSKTTLIIIPEDYQEPVIVASNGEWNGERFTSTDTMRIVQTAFDERLKSINTRNRRNDGEQDK